MLKTNKMRIRRRLRQRTNIKKRARRSLRLSVFRSNRYIYAQVIDDALGVTIASASSLDKSVQDAVKSKGGLNAAVAVGTLVAERAVKKGIEHVYFDRGSYLFHGRVRALANAAREGGLKF